MGDACLVFDKQDAENVPSDLSPMLRSVFNLRAIL